jgi:hypothetical protein
MLTLDGYGLQGPANLLQYTAIHYLNSPEDHMEYRESLVSCNVSSHSLLLQDLVRPLKTVNS